MVTKRNEKAKKETLGAVRVRCSWVWLGTDRNARTARVEGWFWRCVENSVPLHPEITLFLYGTEYYYVRRGRHRSGYGSRRSKA